MNRRSPRHPPGAVAEHNRNTHIPKLSVQEANDGKVFLPITIEISGDKAIRVVHIEFKRGRQVAVRPSVKQRDLAQTNGNAEVELAVGVEISGDNVVTHVGQTVSGSCTELTRAVAG